LPQDFWAGSNATNSKKCLLFEAAGDGNGELVMTISKSDGTQIGEGPSVWLDLKNIKKMYLRGKGQPEGIAAPHRSPNGPFSGPTSFEPDPPFEKERAEEKKAVVFVHGWSMTYNAYLSFSETMSSDYGIRVLRDAFARFDGIHWSLMKGSFMRVSIIVVNTGLFSTGRR
jgi:hypothetical protein